MAVMSQPSTEPTDPNDVAPETDDALPTAEDDIAPPADDHDAADAEADESPPAAADDDTPAPAHPAGTDAIEPAAIVEALLFSTDAPLPASKIAQLLGDAATGREVRACIDQLNERYAAQGASFRIEALAGGYQMLTLPVFTAWLGKLRKARTDTKLSAAALETLAIVAYKQPVLRADVEAIRGVAVGDMLVRLREMNLVKIVGRAEEIGRPLLYGTTRRFLDVFGLASLKDLPKLDEVTREHVPRLRLAEPTPERAENSEPADPPASADTPANDATGSEGE